MDPYLRPLTNPKRVKLVSTCDVCKNRKVKCDKERPECGTCKKTNRKCSYTYATFTETIRDKQSGMKAPNESDFIQTQLDYLQKMQFGQLYDESGYLSMAARGFGTEINESQNVPGMLAMPSDVSDGTSILASEMLQYTSNVISSMPRDPEQQQYDPSYYINNDSLIQQQSLYQSQPSSQQQLSPQQSPHQQMPQQPPSHQPLQQPSQEDAVMEDLITNLKNVNLYESTRYIGEGNLLMVDDDNYGEIIVPQMTKDISEVDGSLKYLPDRETANQLIKLYYDHVHRYFPAIREEVVRNALKDLSKPQHWLLLNCLFFIASPFHDDPKKRDGKIHFDRAEALLYGYCTQPHALTVMSIIILGRHNKQVGSRWMYNGIATKMLFELGLHRKFRNIKMDKEIEKLRIEAFWMTFISENLVSATYGRPNMIDETDCDVDVPSMPSNPNPTSEKTKLEIAYIYLINLSRICARVRKYMHAASRSKFLVQEDENKFRVLDAALASWFNSLPGWLRFEKIVKDPDGILLNGIGGDIHIFFYTILILLHSRYMRPQVPYQHNINITNSSIICMQSATIIVHWLEILLDKHINFFKLSTSGHLAVNPAMSVFTWHVNNENNKKARDMLRRLEIIKPQIDELAGLNEGNINFGEQKWLGIETTPQSRVGNHEIYARDWEVFIRDDDKSIRKQYSLIARKQTGGHFMPRKGSRSMSGSSSMNYTRGIKTNNSQDFNFMFKTDQTFDFSAFSSGQNFNLPQLTIFSEPEQLENQNNQQHYHTPLQQSPQLQPQQYQQFQPQQFNTPLNQSPQSQSQQKYNSPLEQSQHISQEGMELKPPHIDTSSFKLMSDDQQNNVKFNNNNILWTPPQSARSQLWKQPNVNDLPSNTLAATSLSMANTMLTPPMQPQDLFLDDLAADELWNALQNESNNIDFGSVLNYDNNSGHDDGHDSVGLGISMGNNNIQ